MQAPSSSEAGRTAVLLGVALIGLAACGGEVADTAGEAAAIGAEHASARATVEGEVEVLVEDHPAHARIRHFLHTAKGRLELRFDGKAPELRTGSRIRVDGTQSAEILALDPSGAGVTTLATAAVPNTFGEQRTLVVLVNFRDKPVQPWTVEQTRSLVFGEVGDFVRENSSAQAWLAGDVLGWFTLPLDSTVCDQLGIASHAKQAAAAAGADLTSYRRLVYLFPNTSACTWSGAGSVGGSPSQSWINGHFRLDVVGHELGHNLGLYHAHSLGCSDGSVVGPGCTALEYGDGLDIMGWSKAGHFNAFNKERLGWLGGGALPSIATVEASGTYAVGPYAAAGTGVRALKIPKGTDPVTGRRTWYYVEFRQAVGFDAILASTTSMMSAANVLSGVVVHTGSAEESGNTGFLLDMTPETYDLYARDPALPVGRSFTDPAAGVTIATDRADASGAIVAVTLGQGQTDCVRASPAVTVSPATQSGAAGSGLAYQVTVTNRDAPSCGGSDFSLQAATPFAWSGSFAARTLTVPAGASASTSLTVTSPSTAVAGGYAIPITVASAAHTGSAAASYVVAAAPAVTVTTDAPSYTRNRTVTLTATVQVGGVPAPGSAVTFVLETPSGARSAHSATANGSGVAVSTHRVTRKDPPGTYRVTASAVHQGATGVATTSFTVQ
jgi:hypothetical protein